MYFSSEKQAGVRLSMLFCGWLVREVVIVVANYNDCHLLQLLED